MKLIPLTIFTFVFFNTNLFSQKIDSLLEVVAQKNKDIEEVKALTNLAIEYVRKDVGKAKFYLFSSLELSRALHSSKYESVAYAHLISIHNNNANTDSATYYLGELARLAKNQKGPEKKAVLVTYYSAAGLFYKKAGNLPLAVDFLKKAINNSDKEAVRVNLAGQFMNLGNTYNLMGDFKNAITNHLKALKIFEEENNEKGQSFCYQNISNSFIELNQFSRALTYAKKSLEIKKSLNDTRGIATTQNALGQIYQGLNRPALALAHYTQALEVMRSFNLVTEQAKLHYNIAKLQLVQKDTALALKSLAQSRSFAVQLSDSSLVSSVDVQVNAIKTNTGKSSNAEKLMLSGMEKIQKAGQLPKEISGYQQIAEFYAANQEFEKALVYTKKYYNIKDSLSNNELQGQIKSIEEQYNLDKKEKEIAILKKDQQLQEAKYEKQKLYQLGGVVVIILIIGIALVTVSRYRTVQKTRELLQMEKLRNDIARDLHDDIGSTLTSINILSKVLLQQPGLQGESQQLNLKKIKDHSATIMESMSDIVWAINPQNDTVEKVIYKMKEFSAEVLEPLNIEYEFIKEGNFSNVKLNLNKRKDLFLIFKEAINNAAKYSHCDYIKILLKHDGDAIQLHVQDNGKGFDQETVKKGNGLQNIIARSKNMLATLQYKTAPGAGTDMHLTVPSHDLGI